MTKRKRLTVWNAGLLCLLACPVADVTVPADAPAEPLSLSVGMYYHYGDSDTDKTTRTLFVPVTLGYTVNRFIAELTLPCVMIDGSGVLTGTANTMQPGLGNWFSK